jgi:hypothetical protein
MSKRPNCASAASTSAVTSWDLATSAGRAMTDWPVPASLFSAANDSSSKIASRAQIIKFAPASR